MKFDTKFDIGDKVYIIHNASREMKRACPKCNDDPVKIIEGATYTCNFCRGQWTFADGTDKMDREYMWQPVAIHHYYHSLPFTIGKVEVVFTGDGYDQYNKDTGRAIIRYMCKETGVGSGTMWPEDQCFATEVEAQAACYRLNGGNRNDTEVKV